MLTELNYAARGVWGHRIRERRMNRPDPLRGVSSDVLSDEELADVREMTARHAAYYGSFVRRGAARKMDQDTLLNGLAATFREFTRLDCHRYDLPHAEDSHWKENAWRSRPR